MSIHLSQIVCNFFVTLKCTTLVLYPCYRFSRISVFRSKVSHLNLKQVEKIILILKTKKSVWNWNRKIVFKIENGKIVLKLKTENRFEVKKIVLKFKLIWYFKTKNLFKTKKKIFKTVFYLIGVLKFKKPDWRRFLILKTVLKMFKTRFEKTGFAHPYIFGVNSNVVFCKSTRI